MFLPNKTIKNRKCNYGPKKMSVRKTTQYGGDVVMFLPNKIVKNKKIELSAKKMLALKPCARLFKQPMVLLYMV